MISSKLSKLGLPMDTDSKSEDRRPKSEGDSDANCANFHGFSDRSISAYFPWLAVKWGTARKTSKNTRYNIDVQRFNVMFARWHSRKTRYTRYTVDGQ
jgi:hypothetical protein